MNATSSSGVAIIGDVVDSKIDRAKTLEQLETLAGELNARFASDITAPFDYTSGDELQGLLRADCDPFKVLLAAMLDRNAPRMRWGIAFGEVVPGSGPATHRTGDSFVQARHNIEYAKGRHLSVVATTDSGADEILKRLMGVFTHMLEDLTPQQCQIAHGLFVEGRKQSEIAAARGVSRATVSVSVKRGGLHRLGDLIEALDILFAFAVAQRRRDSETSTSA